MADHKSDETKLSLTDKPETMNLYLDGKRQWQILFPKLGKKCSVGWYRIQVQYWSKYWSDQLYHRFCYYNACCQGIFQHLNDGFHCFRFLWTWLTPISLAFKSSNWYPKTNFDSACDKLPSSNSKFDQVNERRSWKWIKNFKSFIPRFSFSS